MLHLKKYFKQAKMGYINVW